MWRQYRYLRTTSTVAALEGIHVEAVRAKSDADRRTLLRGLSDAFATGRHVGAGEVKKVAHLVAAGGNRSARAWLGRLDPGFARQFAEPVLDCAASFGHLNGYAYWDGVSTEPVEEAGPNDGFNPARTGVARTPTRASTRAVASAAAGVPSTGHSGRT